MGRKYQIGVMGSAADLKYSKKIENIAFELGKIIALNGHVMIYGAEKDYDSLSTVAARGAKSVGGISVGITYGKTMDVWDANNNTGIIIATGIERGGGREFVLVNSCDALIVLSGGSGTLNEMTIAYQSNIPIIILKGTGGWADKLGGQYIDERKRLIVQQAKTPELAYKMAVDSIAKKIAIL